jgi:hypothetical protein
MLKSELFESKWNLWTRLWTRRAGLPALCALASLLTVPAASAAVDFTLSATAFSPDATSPGGTSSSNITVVTPTGYSGTVTLGCTVTASVSIPPAQLPTCLVSPASMTSSGGATATINTTGTTPTIGYSMTITGTDASGTVTLPPMDLTVLSVTTQFTITVQSAVAPGSVPAGNGAQAVILVNPLNGYTSPSGGGLFLYCSSMTPLVTLGPVCSFTYPNPSTGLQVNGVATPVTLTISTFGPVPTGAAMRPRNLYALWLFLPMLGLVGVGAIAGGKRSRTAWGLLAIFVLGGSLLMIPACSNTTSTTSTTTPNGITPANTYTFTIVGIDSNGVASSNTGSTVSLTVTAPTTAQ